MKIPAKFNIGKLEYDVLLVENIEHVEVAEGSFLFGLCDPIEQKIYLSTKGKNGNDLSEARIVSTFYHELTHILFGEIADMELYSDEVVVEAVSKNLMSFMDTFTGEAEVQEESDDDELAEEIVAIVTESKNKNKKKK